MTLVLLICNILPINSNVNSRECASIKKLVGNVQNVSSQPGSYAFVGSDYTPAFFGKAFANAFSKLGEGKISHDIVSTIEEYVCPMYGFKCGTDINEGIRKMLE